MNVLEELEKLAAAPDEALTSAEIIPIDLKGRDHRLYVNWRETGSKKSLGELVTSLNPIILKEVKRASGTLPPAALSGRAKQLAVEAISKYDPSRGASISTFVTGELKKLRRLNYTHQNNVRLPENIHLEWHEYNTAYMNLVDKLNREPSDEELSSSLGWKKSKVAKLKASSYADHFESGSDAQADFTQHSKDALLMEYIHDNIDANEKAILYKKDETSAQDHAKELDININRYNYIKTKLKDKVARFKKDLGA